MKTMKQKLIISFSLILLVAVILLIIRDLFSGSRSNELNPCEYNLEKLKIIDSTKICYQVTRLFKPTLSKLKGIAIDNNSTVYILGENEVQVYEREWKQNLSFKIDTPGNCIAVGSQKEMYLGIGNHIVKYDRHGLKLKQWKEYSKKGFITSIAVKDNQVYVADAGNCIVLRYDSAGTVLNTIGKKDKDKGIDGLVVPSMYLDVAIGMFDDLWVANPGRHELENFSFGGDFRSSWGVPSIQLEGFAGCCNPVHFAILPNGYFVTYEKGLDRIKLYDQTGKFDCVVAGPRSFGSTSDYHCSFATLVNDIAVDPQGSIYALDANNNEIKVFNKKSKIEN